MDIIFILIIVALLFKIVKDRKSRKKASVNSATEVFEETAIQEKENANYSDLYQHKWMFTLNEKQAYFKLKEIADKYNLLVFAKVRLFDLVEPVRNHPKYKSNLYRIQAKHVDFVLTKKNLVPKYIIELNDSSHNAAGRKARDEFVAAVLSACGYKVLMVNAITEETLAPILQMEKTTSPESV